MSSKRVQLLSFLYKEALESGVLADILIERSDDYSRFVVFDYDERFLDGVFCVKSNHNESVYNFQKGTLDKVVVEKTDCSKFSIDLEFGLVLISGTNKIITQFISELGNALSNRVSIDRIDVDWNRIIANTVPHYRIKVKRARIAEIPIEHGLLATCTLSFTQDDVESMLLTKYRESLIQLVVTVSADQNNNEYDGIDNRDTVLTIYRSGTIVLNSDDDRFSDEQRDLLYALWNINGRIV